MLFGKGLTSCCTTRAGNNNLFVAQMMEFLFEKKRKKNIVLKEENAGKDILFFYTNDGMIFNPLPDMLILDFFNSAAIKDMMSKIWINGETII